jgi:hypothetical protein
MRKSIENRPMKMPTVFKTKHSVDTLTVRNAIRDAGFEDLVMVIASDDSRMAVQMPCFDWFRKLHVRFGWCVGRCSMNPAIGELNHS